MEIGNKTKFPEVEKHATAKSIPFLDKKNAGNFRKRAGTLQEDLNAIMKYLVYFTILYFFSFIMAFFTSQSWKKSDTTGRFKCLICAEIGKKSEFSVQNALRHFKLCHGMSAEGSKLHNLQKKWRNRCKKPNQLLAGTRLYIGSF